MARTLDHLLHGELLRVELARVLTPVAGIALCGEGPDEDHVALADAVATQHPVLQAAANRHRHGRIDPHRLLDHLRRVRQRHQVVVLQVVVGIAAGDPVDLGDQLLLDVGAGR